MQFEEHVAGPYEGMIQYCVLCGAILCDYRNAMWPAGQKPPAGFPEGTVFRRRQGDATYWQMELADGDTAESCMNSTDTTER